jgi:uncharacterized protein YkwD
MLLFTRRAGGLARAQDVGEIVSGGSRRLGHPVALAAIVLALTAALPAAANANSGLPAQASTFAGCAGAGSVTQDVPHLVRTIFCLHNLERRKHGLRSLRWNHDLSRAAAKYTGSMVRRHYFDHLSPGGTNNVDRLSAAGYGHGSGCWSAGENLSLSRRGRATPAQLLSAWMKSDTHRRNILRPRWREFGLGVAMASPFGEPGGMTIVALFGARFKRACR